MSKRLFIYFGSEWSCHGHKYPDDIMHRYADVEQALRDGKECVRTTQVIFADLKYITEYGYEITIMDCDGMGFDVRIGDCPRTRRQIKPDDNLLELILSGEFDTRNSVSGLPPESD